MQNKGLIMQDLTTKQKNKASLFTLCFTFLIALSGLITIPIENSTIPLVIQNLMPILAGSILGGVQGAGATGLFLVAGALGLPVFAGGNVGLEHIANETGGFILGYFIASLITGLLIGKPNIKETTPLPKIVSAVVVSFIIVYIPGTIQYISVTGATLVEAVNLCVFPFLPYDALKVVITIVLTVRFRPLIAKQLRL